MVLNHLNNLKWRTFLQDVPSPYWRDINDHLLRMISILEVSLRNLEQLQSVFVAQVSLDMSKHGSHLNVIAQKLGTLTTVFVPLMFCGTLWGMNCWIPFQITQTDIIPEGYTFLGIFCVCFIMAVSGFITYHKAKSWLGNKRFTD
ncbi:hypothetical protein RFI_38925 [Reticulomyxa filosa]|nr:hypothetical protein RFI_38925 [Reticulomyxa filosa]|eukprot:ETN98567.1 hypothetical protein RFI_38925 [Reticulomyxa filosa]